MEPMLHPTPTLSHEINNYLSIIYSQLQHIEYLYKYLSKDECWLQMKEDFSSTFQFLKAHMEEESLICASSESTSISTFIEKLYHSWNPKLATQRIHFSIPSEIEQVDLPINKQQLEQIFYNLLTNSYDAICMKSNKEHQSNFISIMTELHPKSYEIKVRDSGCGMSQEQLSKVLNPGISYKKNGHGIGLPLVLEIMHLVQGEFHILSSPGRGTEVILTFPL